ncbi:MAG: DUF6046 domain-containing protein [Bacteroidota bacterium]
MDENHIIATGYNLPPYWLRGKVVILRYAPNSSQASVDTGNGYNTVNQFPLIFKVQGLDDFQFPVDPFISINFKNIITRRTVSKGSKRGTVKERWTEDDADISISGIFQSKDGSYPAEIEKLRAFFAKHEAIDVSCSILNDKNITKIAIESLDFPHTKGADTQAFEIKAYSDDVFQLLIEN